MFTRFITASAVSATLVFSSAAFAASTDFVDNNFFITDTISGLDWRDVTATQGDSYDDVSGQFGVGGNFEGYRYATGTEFNALITNYTGVAIGTTHYSSQWVNSPLMGSLMNSLGITDTPPGSDRLTKGLIADQSAVAASSQSGPLQASSVPMYYNVAQMWEVDYNPVTYYTMAHNYNPQLSSGSDRAVGSFLVRESLIATPIPAAAFMFAPALLGFLGFRRRKMQA